MSKCSITKVRQQRAGYNSRLSQMIKTHSGTYIFLDQPSTRGRNMLVFLLSVILMVSADEEISFTRFVEDDVLLPCNCSNINLTKGFQWQMEADEKKGTRGKLIFKYNTTLNDISNCSLLLKNITLDNEAKYRCSFYSGNQYNRVFVTLKVCGQNISQYSQSTPSGGKVHHCDVKLDCYRKTDIKWTLGGQCLTNSPENNIFITSKNTSHHHFHSTLETNSTNGLEPKCEVNLPRSAGFYNPQTIPTTDNPNHSDPFLKMLCKVVPVVLILGFLLIWCRRRGPSHRLPSERDVENSDFSETSTN